MKRILITGGAGFIGSRLVRGLMEEEPTRRILVFDNLHPQIHGDNAAPPDSNAQVQFVQGDVCDRHRLSDAIAEIQPDTVFHLAAETGTAQSKDCMSRYCEVNVVGTANLMEGLKERAPALERVVLSSSRAVYGEGCYCDADAQIVAPSPRTELRMQSGRFEVVDENGKALTPIPTPEGARTAPVSVYGSTKLMQEYLVQQAAADCSWQPVILRFQNVYGPGQSLRNPYTGVLSIFCSQILAGMSLNIFEDGNIVRDFVYVEDVVRALMLSGNIARPILNPVNIGSGVPVTILETAKILIDILGGAGYRISGQYRAGDVRFAVGDITRARALMGWMPSVDLKTGLRLLAGWAREHEPAHNASGRHPL